MEGMHEIGVQTVAAGFDAGEQGMVVHDLQCVPAHVRDLEGGVAWFDRLDVALDPTKARRDTKLQSALRHKLGADANAQKRAAMPPHACLERLDHAGDGLKPPSAVGEGADAGQDDTICGCNIRG